MSVANGPWWRQVSISASGLAFASAVRPVYIHQYLIHILALLYTFPVCHLPWSIRPIKRPMQHVPTPPYFLLSSALRKRPSLLEDVAIDTGGTD
jgi:hypothetical protein